MVANVVQHKIEKEKQQSKYNNFFSIVSWKNGKENASNYPFFPPFLEEILTKTKCCMALLIKSSKYLLAITMILD